MAAPLHRQRSNVRTYLMVLVVSLIIYGIVASQPSIRAALQSPDAFDAVALVAYTAYASLVLAVYYAVLEVQYRQLLQLAEREAGQAGALAVRDPWTYAVL
ncbi:g11037 [Coccomyxa elongata]